jgi:capsular polysaccharide biosynthesis protein
VAVLAAGIAAAWVLTRPATYESRSVVEIRQNAVFLDAGPGTITKLNGLRRKYAALINTRPIVVPTAEKLKMPPGKVAGSVSAVVNEDSLLMYPVARSRERRDAQRIAQAVSERLVAYAKGEQEAAKVPPDRRIQLRIVDPARPSAKISPKASRAVAMATFTALTGLASVYVLLQLATAGARTRR